MPVASCTGNASEKRFKCKVTRRWVTLLLPPEKKGNAYKEEEEVTDCEKGNTRCIVHVSEKCKVTRMSSSREKENGLHKEGGMFAVGK